MSSIKSISSITAFGRRVVYYPEFGYMLPKYWENKGQGENWIEWQVEQHLGALRILSQCFDAILLPLCHMTLLKDDLMAEIANRVISHRDFIALCEANVFLIGVWDADSKEEAWERMEEFKAGIGWQHIIKRKKVPKLRPSSIDLIRTIEYAGRHVTKQSNFARKAFIDYFQTTEVGRSRDEKKVFASIRKDVETSRYKDIIPFVHERFVPILEYSELADDIKANMLRATNAFYFKYGEIGNPGTVLYYVNGAEDAFVERRSCATDLNVRVYAPDVFREFLRFFITEDTLNNFLSIDTPISKILHLRKADEWAIFKGAYHDMLATLSALIDKHHRMRNYGYDTSEENGLRISDAKLGSMIGRSLRGRGNRLLAIMATTVASVIARLVFSAIGVGSTTLEMEYSFSNDLIERIKRFFIKKLNSDTFTYVRMLDKTLRLPA